jgi:hypothetical protein
MAESDGGNRRRDRDGRHYRGRLSKASFVSTEDPRAAKGSGSDSRPARANAASGAQTEEVLLSSKVAI